MQLLGVSIWMYQGPKTAKEATERVLAASEQLQPAGRIWLPILVFYLNVHLLNFVVACTFLLFPARFVVAFWVGSLILYYAITGQGAPQHTGNISSQLQEMPGQCPSNYAAGFSRLVFRGSGLSAHLQSLH